MKKQALFCMVLAGTLMVGGCGQKAADSTTATAQVTEASDSAPAKGAGDAISLHRRALPE